MDKSFGYLEVNTPTNEQEHEGQYIVVQDACTFLISKEYIAQVEGVNDAFDAQQCEVYDIPAQQYFVDANNTSELITVSDQFILPDGENQIENKNLLETEYSESNEQLEEKMVMDNEGKPQELNKIISSEKDQQNLTEITLDDKQYQILERKGWLLLQEADKVYLLDPSGLHNITDNEKLIEKLKNEVEDNNIIKNGSQINSQENSSQDMQFESCPLNSKSNEELPSIVKVEENTTAETCNEKQTTTMTVKKQSNVKTARQKQPLHKNTVRLATNIMFKDIPDKIILGKTKNGKRLVAKILKTDGKEGLKEINLKKPEVIPQIKFRKVVNTNVENDAKTVDKDSSSENESSLTELVSEWLQAGENPKLADIAEAETVLTHLMRVPIFKSSLINKNLFFSKVKVNESGAKIERTSLVSGWMTSLDEPAGQCRFVHLPDLLTTIKNENLVKAWQGADDQGSVVHVEVSERRRDAGHVRLAVTLHNYVLSPVDGPSKGRAGVAPGPGPLHACGACARVYHTTTELSDHLLNECLDAYKTTTDTDTVNTHNGILCSVDADNEKIYTCMQCKSKFNRLSNCQRHFKTHLNLSTEVSGEDSGESSTRTVGKFRCRMCTSSYHHPSSLSKHIVRKHIIKSNKLF